ncbi:MAG: PKD domain-containing protein [Salinivirgaceae bacterium]
MKLKHNFLTISMLALASTLLIFTACEKDNDDDAVKPIAAFTADIMDTNVGDSISFTDQSTHNPVSWRWDFGDGNISDERNPTHIYTDTGSYTITLTVSNSYGSDSEMKENYIKVSEEEIEYFCQALDGVPENCEIPTICCPSDGSDCFYVNPDGEDYYCDVTQASDSNPDGCNEAIDNYINDHCSKMPKSEMIPITIKMSAFTKKLLEKARRQSVCM